MLFLIQKLSQTHFDERSMIYDKYNIKVSQISSNIEELMSIYKGHFQSYFHLQHTVDECKTEYIIK